jgi:hypothetical protein
MVAVDPNIILGFSLTASNSTDFRFFQKVSMISPVIEDTSIRYLEILFPGKVKLYANRKVGVGLEMVVSGKGGMFSRNVYTPEPFYLFQIENLPITYIQMRKRSIINAFPEYTAKIKSIFRENRVRNVRTEYNLIQAVKTLNSKW